MMTDEILSTMVNRIVGRFNPVSIILFGSHARGDARKWSDVDLLVIMSRAPNKRQIAVEMRRLLSDLMVSKDIIVTTAELEEKRNIVGTLFHAALRDGRTLYEQS